jgi:hypothetical protein
MDTRSLTLAGAIGLAAAAPAAAQEFFDHMAFTALLGSPASVVSFDDRAPRSTLAGNEYAGLTIGARRIAVVNPQDFAPGLAVGGQNVNSQPHGISASIFYSGSTLVFDNQTDDFRLTLAAPAPAAGLWIGNLGNDNDDPVTPTTVSFFDAQGGLLASEVLRQGHAGMIGSGANNRIFYGLVAVLPIASITVFNGAGDFDGVILDDIQWAAAVVPEPAAWVLALAGLGTLLARRRIRA